LERDVVHKVFQSVNFPIPLPMNHSKPAAMECGGKRRATPLWLGGLAGAGEPKRRRRCALPAHSILAAPRFRGAWRALVRGILSPFPCQAVDRWSRITSQVCQGNGDKGMSGRKSNARIWSEVGLVHASWPLVRDDRESFHRVECPPWASPDLAAAHSYAT